MRVLSNTSYFPLFDTQCVIRIILKYDIVYVCRPTIDIHVDKIAGNWYLYIDNKVNIHIESLIFFVSYCGLHSAVNICIKVKMNDLKLDKVN